MQSHVIEQKQVGVGGRKRRFADLHGDWTFSCYFMSDISIICKWLWDHRLLTSLYLLHI